MSEYNRQRFFKIRDKFDRRDIDIKYVSYIIHSLYNDIKRNDDCQLENFYKIINDILDSALTWSDMVKQEINKDEIDIKKELNEIDKQQGDINQTNNPYMTELNIERKF